MDFGEVTELIIECVNLIDLGGHLFLFIVIENAKIVMSLQVDITSIIVWFAWRA
jgi:hypothetical protein